jgi:hypothetical protein
MKFTDAEILEVLKDNCENAYISSLYIGELIENLTVVGNTAYVISEVGNSYTGAAKGSTESFYYNKAVVGAYLILGGSMLSLEETKSLNETKPDADKLQDKPPNAAFCVEFGRYSAKISSRSKPSLHVFPEGEGDQYIDLGDLNMTLNVDKQKSVLIKFWSGERAFGDLSESLAERRREAWTDVARELGVDQERVELMRATSSGVLSCRTAIGRSYAGFEFTK